MADKKEYLNEEWYQKTKKKVKKISLIVLVASLVIGGGLIAFGIIATKNSESTAEKINQERYDAAAAELQVTLDKTQARIDEIKTQLSTLEERYNAKNRECDSLPMGTSTWFADVNACHSEASSIKSQMNNLNIEKFDLENRTFTVNYDKAEVTNYYFLAFIGGGLILFGIITSLMIYFIAMRREIAAFSIQQTMPLAQEGISKMTPTVGNAAGEIAKDITSGIKDGLKGPGNN